ncbi:hypothetical protein QTP86_034186 [Hemibagrus guttatus]|nr:hypothetical protein QTP86_034186 [Hemibagrus guttatus]
MVFHQQPHPQCHEDQRAHCGLFRKSNSGRHSPIYINSRLRLSINRIDSRYAAGTGSPFTPELELTAFPAGLRESGRFNNMFQI